MAVKRDTKSKMGKTKSTKITVRNATKKETAAITSSPDFVAAQEKRREDLTASQKIIDDMQRRKKRPLKPKEAKLIKGIVAGKTRRKAARDAGITGSDEVVSVTASRMLSNVNVKEALQQALLDAGVGLEDVAQVVADGMKATKLVIVGNGEDAMADLQPDHSIRLNAGKMAAKYLRAEDPDPLPQGGNTFNFINNANFNSKDYVSES